MNIILKAITPFLSASSIFLLLALIFKETQNTNSTTEEALTINLSNENRETVKTKEP